MQPHAEPAPGQWASPEDRIGKVQCCLPLPSVRVCTRYGCLSGTNDDTKKTWAEARQLCESRGWRLCSAQELNRKGLSLPPPPLPLRLLFW